MVQKREEKGIRQLGIPGLMFVIGLFFCCAMGYNTFQIPRYTHLLKRQVEPPTAEDRKYGFCQRRKFETGHPFTALASFQGSGNTWTRYLMEQITGMKMIDR